MFLAKTPRIVQSLLPGYTWHRRVQQKTLYLTFDDGPIPDITPWVLEQLQTYEAKATFFCVGDNVRKHPDVFREVTARGHSVGNHTFNHLNGWKTGTESYLENVAECQEILDKTRGIPTPDGETYDFDRPLFRPPYGRLTRRQKHSLQGKYEIVMWDVLSGDFSKSLSPEKVLQNVLLNARPGSIVVLHDSLKAEENLRFVLPEILGYFSHRGYQFEALNSGTR